ncbi:hypothetical protein ACULNC_17265 [Shigella flexneri]
MNSQTRTLTSTVKSRCRPPRSTPISLVDGNGNPVSVEVRVRHRRREKVKVSRVPDCVAEYSVWGAEAADAAPAPVPLR